MKTKTPISKEAATERKLRYIASQLALLSAEEQQQLAELVGVILSKEEKALTN